MGSYTSKGYHKPPASFYRKLRKADKIRESDNEAFDNNFSQFTASGYVFIYLVENPNFLDEFVEHKVNRHRVTTWLRIANKKPRESVIYSEGVLNIEKFTENAVSSFSQSKELLSRLIFPPSNCVTEQKLLELNKYLWSKFPNIDNHLLEYLQLADHELNPALMYLFEDLFGPDEFDQKTLLNFLTDVKASYFPAQYHNYHHAFSHAHTMYWILKSNLNAFSRTEKKALMVSSICHDVGHPGVNETFLIKVFKEDFFQSPLLEHHHIQTTYCLLMKGKNNIFGDLSEDEFKSVVNDIEECILATFPNRYQEKMKLISSLIERGFDFKDDECRNQAKCCLMIVCDLCLSWKGWRDHIYGTWCLYQEFAHQGELQMQLGMDTMDLMKRDVFENNIDKMQLFFLGNICLPLFEEAAKIFPCMHAAVQSTKGNIEKWEAILKSKTKKE